MANQFSWKFGTYDRATMMFTETDGAHWFFDAYWTPGATSGTGIAIEITNRTERIGYLKTFKFSLINGMSDGVSFTDSAGASHITYESTASIVAKVDSILSDSISVSRGHQTFIYNPSAGQSYWKYRPANAAGSPFPDSDDHSLVEYYTFTFPEKIEVLPGQSKLITFSCVWNTTGEHCMQIYAVNGIIIPQVFTVTWKLNGGEVEGSSDDVIHYIPEGEDDIPPVPIKQHHNFTGWLPSSGWVNITENKVFTAQWTLSSVIWRFNGDLNEWEKVLSPHVYDTESDNWLIDNSKYHIM